MKRIHLRELHDLSWFPSSWRDLFTDCLSRFEADKDIFAPVAGLLAPLIEGSPDFTIVDLCSGAGLPVMGVLDSLDEAVAGKVRLTLTDKYPNIAALERVSSESRGNVSLVNRSVDALDVPGDLVGFRTLFSSFHHFDEGSARAILSDAVSKRQGIGVFEFTDRRLLSRLLYYGIPLQIWLLRNTPSFRPHRRHRILWTYVIPVVPLALCWDGVVLCLRSYSPSELRGLIDEFRDVDYSWDIGRVESTRPFRVTYLIGRPAEKISTS